MRYRSAVRLSVGGARADESSTQTVVTKTMTIATAKSAAAELATEFAAKTATPKAAASESTFAFEGTQATAAAGQFAKQSA